MTDLHCHILPGLDDGAKDVSEALEMSRAAVADGIIEMVATPHTEDGLYQNRGADICKAVRLFQQALIQHQIPLAVYPGSEVHIHANLVDQVKQGEVLTLCDMRKYLLLELPSLFLPRYTDQVIANLIEAGITPLLSHPERNEYLRANPARLQTWIKQGACMQINAGSLLGLGGKQIRQHAIHLLQSGCVHVMASDGHNRKHRPPLLAAAYQVVEKAGSAAARTVLESNAQAVLQGGKCEAVNLGRSSKKRFFYFWK